MRAPSRVLFCLAMPAILLAVLAGGLVAVLAGLLSTVGLTHRQPRAPWHRAGVALRVLLRRTAGADPAQFAGPGRVPRLAYCLTASTWITRRMSSAKP